MKLTQYFEDFLKSDSIFLNREILQPNYLPEKVIYREKEISEIAKILSPSLKKQKPSNLFIYGKTGTGKTLVVKTVLNSLTEITQKNNLPLKLFYLNCKLKKTADTEYRLLSQIIKYFGEEVPFSGLPTDELYNRFYKLLEKENSIFVLVLDEIDELIKKTGDSLLYNLTRINSEMKSQITLIGISNTFNFIEDLDPRVKSSLAEEEIVFSPYNAYQLQHILKERSEKAFRPNTLKAGVIEKCAALAAQEHGDARMAIDLLRVAAEVAERKNNKKISLEDLDEAKRKFEYNLITNSIISYPKQFLIIVYILVSSPEKKFSSGEIYLNYQKICQKTNFPVLTQRRVSDIINELDLAGLISTKTISKGRYGRTKEIMVCIKPELSQQLKEIVSKELSLK